MNKNEIKTVGIIGFGVVGQAVANTLQKKYEIRKYKIGRIIK